MIRLALAGIAVLVALASTSRAAEDPNGAWKWSVTRNDQTREVTLRLKLEGDKLTGTIVGRDNQETPIERATYKDGQISFTSTRELNNQKVTIRYSGKLSGNTIKGKQETERDGEKRSVEWEATRSVESRSEAGKPLRAADSPTAEKDGAELRNWKNYESLSSPADWQARGKDSKVEVTSRGLLLLENSRMASRFQLGNGASIRFVYATNNRNVIVHLCDKDIKVVAPSHDGREQYLLEVDRKGRALSGKLSIIDPRGRPVGKPIKTLAIQIDAAAVNKPSTVVLSSEPVLGRGDTVSELIRFKSIVVSGPVLLPADAAKREKQ